MKSDLIWGWVFVGLALLMAVLAIYCCFIGNWTAVPMCSFALAINVCNAISRFTDYKRRQQDIADLNQWLRNMVEAAADDNSRITD